MTIPRGNILGVHVSAVNMAQALETIDGWLEKQERHYVCITNAHGILECRDHPEWRTIFNRSGMTTPDGMSLVWLLKLRGHRSVSRVYGPDLMRLVCEHSVPACRRHFFYGSTPETLADLSRGLQKKYPGLQVAGMHSPPFRPLTPAEGDEVVRMINKAKPDILWVGISTPKQEQWMAEHYGKLNATVLIGVGAAFDFLSGRKRQAPRWMQRSGLEWLFRLATEPGRLWRRYARYPLFCLLAAAHLLGLTRYD
ncbi:MAG: WecB/TagA/CpsF family glycosyltransferase [Anaerolineales bacterium]|nr:WecB/TagA/CpsF family glycosyltransferase [Anaerolineales bacterium]